MGLIDLFEPPVIKPKRTRVVKVLPEDEEENPAPKPAPKPPPKAPPRRRPYKYRSRTEYFARNKVRLNTLRRIKTRQKRIDRYLAEIEVMRREIIEMQAQLTRVPPSGRF